MQKIFINHTNHPTDSWTETERKAAEVYGKVKEIAFPAIDPEWDETKIGQLAQENGKKILSMNPAAVLCQGEFTYCFALVTFLKAHGVTVLSACSTRETETWAQGDGNLKISKFVFVRFRRY